MFRGDLRRAASCKQCVGKFLAAVGFREPPRGGVNQGKALDRGKVRLTRTQDCHGSQPLSMRDETCAARGPHDRLIAITKHRSGQLQRPRQVQLIQMRPGRVVEDPGHRRPLLQHPGDRASTPGRKPEHYARGFLALQHERAAIQFHHLTAIQHHPESIGIELHRVWHRVSTLFYRVGDQGRGSVFTAPALGRLIRGRVRAP
jgi:hypothetical protein